MTEPVIVALIAAGGASIAATIAGVAGHLAAKKRSETLMGKVAEIHVLVNDRLDAALKKIALLEELLRERHAEIPSNTPGV
jgi:hypothetical protein